MRGHLLMQKAWSGSEERREMGRRGGRQLNCFEGILNDLCYVVGYASGLEKC